MNKYYEALDSLYKSIGWWDYYNDCARSESFNKNADSAKETLLSLIHKMEKIGLELNNTHFMDNDCKLKTLEMIERIFNE